MRRGMGILQLFTLNTYLRFSWYVVADNMTSRSRNTSAAAAAVVVLNKSSILPAIPRRPPIDHNQPTAAHNSDLLRASNRVSTQYLRETFSPNR